MSFWEHIFCARETSYPNQNMQHDSQVDRAKSASSIWTWPVRLADVDCAGTLSPQHRTAKDSPSASQLSTCFSCVSEFTCTSHISQWNVLFWRPVFPLLTGPLPFTPARGKAFMVPLPLRASSIVLCLVPGDIRNGKQKQLWQFGRVHWFLFFLQENPMKLSLVPLLSLEYACDCLDHIHTNGTVVQICYLIIELDSCRQLALAKEPKANTTAARVAQSGVLRRS